MNVLYHNCPGQRTLLITHSNQALNDLFEKIMQRDIPSRYLLRLGEGLAGQGGMRRGEGDTWGREGGRGSRGSESWKLTPHTSPHTSPHLQVWVSRSWTLMRTTAEPGASTPCWRAGDGGK